MLAIRSRLSGVLAASRLDCSVGVALLPGGRFFFLRTPSVGCQLKTLIWSRLNDCIYSGDRSARVTHLDPVLSF